MDRTGHWALVALLPSPLPSSPAPCPQDKAAVCWLPVPVLGRFQKASSSLCLLLGRAQESCLQPGMGVLGEGPGGGGCVGGTVAEGAPICELSATHRKLKVSSSRIALGLDSVR